MTLELTSETFRSEVLEAPVPVLVDFWSPTCGPCRRLAPIVEELAAEAEGQYRVAKVDAYDQPDLAARFRISALPTLLLFQQGELVQSLIGYHDKAALRKLLGELSAVQSR